MEKNTFIEFKGEILSERPKNFEQASVYDKDIMFIKAVAIEEGINLNNALFERTELHKSLSSFTGKPLRILLKEGKPSGHGFNPMTGKFDKEVEQIGYIYDVSAEVVSINGEVISVTYDDFHELDKYDGKYRVVVHIAMWQGLYPEVSRTLRDLHENGELAFSIEATRDYELLENGVRRCFNILFNALAVVKTPAFENARSIMVAELLNTQEQGGTKSMDFEKLYKDEVAKTASLETEVASLSEKVTDLSAELAELKGTVAEKDAEIASVQSERDSLKQVVETAEKERVGEERFVKLSKYGEVAKSKEELAEMTKEDFVETLIEAVEGYKPEVASANSNETDDIIGVNFHKKKENAGNKEKLMGLLTGFGK